VEHRLASPQQSGPGHSLTGLSEAMKAWQRSKVTSNCRRKPRASQHSQIQRPRQKSPESEAPGSDSKAPYPNAPNDAVARQPVQRPQAREHNNHFCIGTAAGIAPQKNARSSHIFASSLWPCVVTSADLRYKRGWRGRLGVRVGVSGACETSDLGVWLVRIPVAFRPQLHESGHERVHVAAALADQADRGFGERGTDLVADGSVELDVVSGEHRALADMAGERPGLAAGSHQDRVA
jgi:hypothetical protein